MPRLPPTLLTRAPLALRLPSLLYRSIALVRCAFFLLRCVCALLILENRLSEYR
jgi:hypothetical protein